LKGKGPFQGVFSWVAWKGGGWVVSKGKGVVLCSFFLPFQKGLNDKEISLVFLRCKKTFKLDVIIFVQGQFGAIL